MDYSIRLWDLARRQRLVTLQGHLSEVWSLAFSPDGQTVASGAKDGSVKSWPIRPQQKDDVLAGGWQPLGFSKNSRILAARNSRQGTVVFFDVATHEPDQQFQTDSGRFRFAFPAPAALSEDLGTLVQGLDNGAVKIWDTENREFQTLRASDRPLDLLALSPDGRTLITGEGGMPGPGPGPGGRGRRTLRWWDLRHETNAVLLTDAHKVLFAPDGRTLAAFQRANTIQLWDVPTRSLRTNLVIDPQPATVGMFPPDFRFFSSPAAFSPDGRVMAAGCADDAIRLWEVDTGKLISTCTGHKQAVSSLAFAPDGKTLASASDDSTLKFWNLATQQELLTIRRLGGTLRSLLFSPDGRLLVGASGFSQSSGGLRFFHAPTLAETDQAAAKSIF
jgi:WD40 repeat protein